MKRRSIRFRLAAWYAAVLAAALIAFGGLSWLAVRHVLLYTVNNTLRDRIEGVHRFMEHQTGALSVEEIRDEFKEHSVLGPGGDLFQVCDAQGVWLYRSVPLEDGGVAIPLPPRLPASGSFEDRAVRGADLRFLAQRIQVAGKPFTVQVAVPMHELNEGLAGFAWALAVLTPGVLAAATAGGWWISGRALRPVGRIIEAARTIGEQSLSSRLPVPGTQDELQRLSETLNQMLSRIESAFRRITEFTADASHELRTPVALIRATAELALRKPREVGEYRQALDEVHGETIRTTALIEDLLTLARADAGKETLDCQPIDLVTVVREAGKQGEKLAAAKNLDFRIDVPAAPVPSYGDPASLRRLLLIVIDNAVKYTRQGAVEVRLAACGALSEIEVSDTGVGIAAEDVPHVFERFYRADKSRSRESGGAGLGLSIAEWIARAHRGRLEMRSELNRGTTLRITLPGATS
jgi:heavy metal sensor kinase